MVFFFGDRAYKAKKAVDLGFLDFTSLESRRLACQREMELNRRLAPDVYLGVAAVTDAVGRVCEHLVVMRRMPEDRRLSTLAVAGAEISDGVRAIAELLAAFHHVAPALPVASAAASAPGVNARWEQITATVLKYGADDTGRAASAILADARTYLAGRSPLFEERIESGCARDGHGDLLADDIFLLDDGPRVLDCLDFDEQLRCGDVLADIAFLAMDLERIGRKDLAWTLLASYRDAASAAWPTSLEHHYVAQRAMVRAGVMLIRAEQGDPTASGAAAALVAIARHHLEAGTVRMVVVGGLPGTGKSTVASGVAERIGATLLRSDEIRQGIGFEDETRYESRSIDRTYGELLARASHLLARGETVVLDATWRAPCHRLAAEGLAGAVSADLRIIECRSPDDVADRRIEARRLAGVDPSEATVAVAAELREMWHPWSGAIPIDTTTTVEAAVSAAVEASTRTEEHDHD